MAAITTFDEKGMGGLWLLKNASAQADTGQTRWLKTPPWAMSLQLFLNITAVAGTTPIATPVLLAADPVSRDDGDAPILATFTTPPTDVGTHIISVGPGVSPADDLAMAATGDSFSSFNFALPPLLGVRLTLDRGSANETYTYTLAAVWAR